MEVDDVYQLLGKYGKFQIKIYVLLAFVNFPWSFHTLSYVLFALEPPYHCKLPPDSPINTSIPFIHDEKGWHYSQCDVFLNYSIEENRTSPCPMGFEYDQMFGETIVTKWDLVCSDTYKVSLQASILMTGVIVGGVILAQLSDKIGRKKVLLFSLAVQVIFNLVSLFMPEFVSFTILRFLVGFCIPGYGMTSYVMSAEVLPASLRHLTITLGFIFWALAMMLMALLAYLIKDWFYFQLIISLFSLLFIPYYWLVPESIHWLVSMGRYKEAEKIVQDAAKLNGVKVPEHCFTPAKALTTLEEYNSVPINDVEIEEEETEKHVEYGERSYNMIDLVKHPVLRFQTIIQLYIWFVNSIVYFGLTNFSSSISGDPYINFTISAAVEIPALVIATFMVYRFGRKKMLALFHLVAGIPLLILAFVPYTAPSWVSTTLSSIGKLGITASFLVIFLYAGELYPTVVRNVGLGFASTASRIAATIAPFSIYMARVHPSLCPIIFAILALVAAMMGVCLPETSGKPLPETLDDVKPYNGLTKLLQKLKHRCGSRQSHPSTNKLMSQLNGNA